MKKTELIGYLQDRMTLPLPGREAQMRMAHAARHAYNPPPDDANVAAVLALLVPKEDTWSLVYIERTSHNPNDKHGGQISFPGGRQETEDSSLWHTACREVEEEIGIPVSTIQKVGALTPMYIPVSNYMVHPFLGYLPHMPQFELQASEVADVLLATLLELQDADSVQYAQIRVRHNITLRNVPFYAIEGRTVWGATAMITSEILSLLPTPMHSSPPNR